MWRKIFLMIIGIVFILLLTEYVLTGLSAKNAKKEIIGLTLKYALIEQKIPGYNLIEDKKNIVLSRENIGTNWIPNLADINFILLSPKEIYEKANKEGDFLYLRFSELEIGRLKTVVSLNNIWAVGKNSKWVYLSGGGFTIIYYNIFGHWIDKIESSWIS
jgi:hypothetical protein